MQQPKNLLGTEEKASKVASSRFKRASDAAYTSVRKLDTLSARVLSKKPEKHVLTLFHFHALCDEYPKNPDLEAGQLLTIASFEEVIERLLQDSWHFVSPSDIAKGIRGGRNVLLTFDDGYANNALALPVLEKFKVPAAFYISTAHVESQRSYWWDVLYRERMTRGVTEDALKKERTLLKHQPYHVVEEYITKTFGNNAWVVRGEMDRPFTEEELQAFSKNPYVHLGNHTLHHAILPNLTENEIRAEIAGAQSYLQERTGKAPISISYPNGNVNALVQRIAQEEGLHVGIGVKPHRNVLPLAPEEDRMMHLGRFSIDRYRSIEDQLKGALNDPLISFSGLASRLGGPLRFLR